MALCRGVNAVEIEIAIRIGADGRAVEARLGDVGHAERLRVGRHHIADGEQVDLNDVGVGVGRRRGRQQA